MSGVKIVDGDFIGWCHADLQTEPKDVYDAYNGLSRFVHSTGGGQWEQRSVDLDSNNDTMFAR